MKINNDKWKQSLTMGAMLAVGVDLVKQINSLGGQALIVGGTVRDIITGDIPHDIDIATNVSTEKLEKHFQTHDIGASRDFGIVTIKHKGFDFEVAQYREDGEYGDGRRPDAINIVKDFKSDAARRDLTINSMGINENGNIIDYFGGQQDIENKIIKMVGDSDKRLQEDKLRMLRVVRFAAKLDFDIDLRTKQSLIKFAPQITKISRERVRDELLKMGSYGGKKFAKAIQILDQVGILQYILPEISVMKSFEHCPEYHPEGNCFQHTIGALQSSQSSDPVTNLAILLHDVGKTITRTYDDEGKVRYLKHADRGIDLIDGIADRLKLKNKDRQTIKFTTANHMKFHDVDKMKNSKIHKLIQDNDFNKLVDVCYADSACRLHLHNEQDWKKIIDKIEHVKNIMKPTEYDQLRKLVSGNIIMELLNIKPSKKLGQIIDDTLEYAIDNNIKTSDQLYKYIVDNYKEK